MRSVTRKREYCGASLVGSIIVLASSHQSEPHPHKILVERERVAQPLAPHHLEAHRVGQAEDLVLISAHPPLDGVARELLINPHEPVALSHERVPESQARLDATPPRDQGVALDHHEVRGDHVAPARTDLAPRAHRGAVTLIPRVEQREPPGRVYEDRRGNRAIRVVTSRARCSSWRSARSRGTRGPDSTPTSASIASWKAFPSWRASSSSPRRNTSARDTPPVRAKRSSAARSPRVR